MNNNNYLLQKFEAISLILIVMINKLILNVPYYVVSIVGSGSPLNLIFIGIIDFLVVLLLLKLFEHFSNFDIIDISKYLGRKFIKKYY